VHGDLLQHAGQQATDDHPGVLRLNGAERGHCSRG
jgi:hypothetical protein